MTDPKKPYKQDGDESDSDELGGVTGDARKPGPAQPNPQQPPHKDGNSPDGEEG